MRSSIACARCRRSKVKCLNNGVNTACRACVVAGRECIYPVPASSDRLHRRDDSFGRDPLLSTPDGSRSVKAKSRKSQNVSFGPAISTRAPVDALSSSILTTHVWLELFDIWQQNYSIDLPFLHSTSFTRLLREAKGFPSQHDFNTPRFTSNDSIPPIGPELLLAFLALTSRFHPSVVTHHSSTRPGNPLAAADYYATVCREKLLNSSSAPPTLARIQALLMLTIHEWGDCHSSRAWSCLQEAVKIAKLLGYGQRLDATNNYAIVQPVVPELGGYSNTSEDMLQDLETKRRTFWACFILERNLSSGVFRPLAIQSDQVDIPLPASEKSYLFNEKVKTQFLSEWLDDAYAMNGEHRSAASRSTRRFSGSLKSPRENYDDLILEVGQAEGALGRYVKASELYNTILQWAGRGGRLNETHHPWDSQSTWFALYRSVSKLSDKLPRDLTLSSANISAHIVTRSAVSFTLLHTSLLLSKIILLREFLPFLPFQATHPTGPIDRLSPFSQSSSPESAGTFWEDSAVELFKAAQDLLNLFLACSERKLLVETPLVGFASYVIAALGIYSSHFPWMDTKDFMSHSVLSRGGARDAEPTTKAVGIVLAVKSRLRLAEGWFRSLGRLHRYYARTKKELTRHLMQDKRQAQQHLPSIQAMNESQLQLDRVFGGSQGYSHDTEMIDVQSQATSFGAQADRGQTESVARESWAAVNAPNQPQDQEVNGSGYHSHGQQSPGARSNYPPISPQALSQPYSPANLPQFPYNSPYPPPPTKSPRTSAAIADAAQEPRPAAAPTSKSWSPEQFDDWLDSLPVVFGANDLIAFAEAVDWMQFASPNSSVNGWLSLIWAK